MYALPRRGLVVSGPLENASEPPTNYLIIEGRKEYLRQPVEGHIYRVPVSDFRRVYGPGGGATNEWVCPYPVPIDRAGPVEHIKSIDQILAAGVQVFFVSDKANSETISRSLANSSRTAEQLASLVKSANWFARI